MTDKIHIKDLEVFCNHGVFPEENKLGQKFLVSTVLFTDTREAGLTDELEKSIDYGAISHRIHDFLQKNTYRLIERAAEELADHLLKATPRLERIQIEIKKPWAPIGLPLAYASVEITRGWHTAYIGLGSNMGDTRKYIEDAIGALTQMDDCRVEAVSGLRVTKPYGVTDQDDFLNGCLQLRTLLPPRELLDRLHTLEHAAGRERTRPWGPRTLDLDILLYDELVMQTPDLTIPHADMQNRAFVLEPMVEIAPYTLHPLLNKTMLQLRDTLQ
ncbi:MAG: 2-amino-4-hydroxy-6-hydroxymethyldihydropteridine diphosphokinase [Oscillospiraceae bacterium]|nr:2-amino-4-hydroxy-6-hydroxymethyldihydropteridine diphosphokinase [Oscillospiraceae bacterium]